MDYESIMMSILLDTGDKQQVLEFYEEKYNDIQCWKAENMKGVKISKETIDNMKVRNIIKLNNAFQKVYKIHI